MAGSVRMDRVARAATVAAPGGQDGGTPEFGWWNRYHNQLLVAALTASVATVAAFLLVGDTASWYPAIFLGVGLGVGLAIGFLLGSGKQYAQIDAGKFIRANMSRRLRITQDLSLPAAIILLAIVIVYYIHAGWFDRLPALMLALGIAFWAQYGITILWERRHRTTLIAKKGSMYTLDTNAEGEPIWQ
ncbi:hypothetical protein FKB36_10240 [Methanoculleus sp. Afa-1]|uniref:Uncharacterized protein n=2 Tax=Methanoculleus formosensis TaxID=2590886 RepID=A0A9E4ZKJ6_9EURY|nr:hypothetical protein [Methanoculleus sp. Afa-1]